MSTASDLYYTQVAHQLDPIQWEALTPREQAGWEYAAGIADRAASTRIPLLKDDPDGTPDAIADRAASTVQADDGLRARIEALCSEWETTRYKIPPGYPITVDQFSREWFVEPLRAALDASPAPTTPLDPTEETNQ